MPETDALNTDGPGMDAPPAQAEEARAGGLRRKAGDPPAHGPGLLPGVFEELNATVEELRVAEEEMRVQNEELLRTRHRVEAERHRYQDLFESAPDGYFVTAPDGRILEANRAASALLGIAPRFLKGRGLAASVAPEDLPAFYAALKAVAASPASAPPQEWAMRLRRRHAGPFHAAVTVAPVAAGGDRPASLRWLVRDVTARRQAEEDRLARAQAAGARERGDGLPGLLAHAVPADAFPRLSVEAFPPAGAGGAEAGGFFDAFALDGGRVALVVGDAGGGPDAAARAAGIKYALRVFLRQAGRPASALARLNDFVVEARRLGDPGGDRPVALSLATVDTETGGALFATAGGDPPRVLRSGGKAEIFGAAGEALGVGSDASYPEGQTALGTGDTLLISHALPRRADLAEAARHADTLRGMGRAVLDAARAGGTLGDDASLLLARRRE